MIYGADDRREFHQLDQAARAAAARVVAIARKGSAPAPLREVWQLCPSERLAEEPHLSDCTGLLVADDLVLTPSHCLPTPAACATTEALSGYWYASSDGNPALAARHLGCREVVATTAHLVVFRVDRQAPSVSLAWTARPPRAGEPLLTLGYPAGLPLKGDGGGRVASAEPCFVSADAAAGSSGSPVFDAHMQVLGILLGGEVDLEWAGDCKVSRHLSDAEGREFLLTTPKIARGLCATESAEVRQLFCPLSHGGGTAPGLVGAGLAVALVALLALVWKRRRRRSGESPERE